MKSPARWAVAQELQRFPSTHMTAAAQETVRPLIWTNGLLGRFGLYLVLSAVFTMIMVNYSMQYGRLAIGPTDDDCVYLVDSLQRLQILHDNPRHFLRNLVQHPPHSPFSTGLGIVSFLIFGPHQWAPYVCNGLVVLALLLIVDYLVTGRSAETRFAAVLFTLTFPFTANLVTEFRPDCAVGVVTAFGVVLLLKNSPLTASRGHALWVGSLAAAALLVKPSFAPFTAFTFGIAWLLSAFFIHYSRTRSDFRLPHLLGQIGWYLLPVVVLAVPYYAAHFEIVRYIQNQAFGKYKSQWALNEPPKHILRYYWDGAGGQMMLGRDRWTVLLLGCAGLVLGWRRAAANWRFIAGYLAVLAVAYAIPTITRMANPFFGADHDVLILLGAVMILAALFAEAGERPGRSALFFRAAAWLAVGISLIAFQWPAAHYDRGSDWARTVNRLGHDLYHSVRDYPGSRNARVFFTAPGPVDDMLFRFNALSDNSTFSCPNRHLSGDAQSFRQEIEAADFVIASDPGTGVVYEKMIAPNIQQDALTLAQEDGHLTELVRLPALNGKFFHVFVRQGLSSRAAESKTVPFEDPWAPLYGRD